MFGNFFRIELAGKYCTNGRNFRRTAEEPQTSLQFWHYTKRRQENTMHSVHPIPLSFFLFWTVHSVLLLQVKRPRTEQCSPHNHFGAKTFEFEAKSCVKKDVSWLCLSLASTLVLSQGHLPFQTCVLLGIDCEFFSTGLFFVTEESKNRKRNTCWSCDAPAARRDLIGRRQCYTAHSIASINPTS